MWYLKKDTGGAACVGYCICYCIVWTPIYDLHRIMLPSLKLYTKIENGLCKVQGTVQIVLILSRVEYVMYSINVDSYWGLPIIVLWWGY